MTEPQISDEAAIVAAQVLAGVDQYREVGTAWVDCARRALAAAVPLLYQQWAAEQCPLESYTITTECRVNRGDDGAWEEAVARLRRVYDAQLARFGAAAVYRIEFHREPAPGIPRYVYDAAHGVQPGGSQ
jgi:hypothetical protein